MATVASRILGSAAGEEVAAEAGRNVDHWAQVAGAQTAVDLRFVAQRRLLPEIARGVEVFDQLPAVGAVITIDHGK